MPHLESSLLAVLTIPELKEQLRGQMEMPRAATKCKADMVEWIIVHADLDLKTHLTEVCEQKCHRIEQTAQSKKRKRHETQRMQRKIRRVERIDRSAEHDIEKYLDLASEAQLDQCFLEFIEATSNSAMKHVLCAVCAREVSVQEDNVHTLRSEDIPHAHRLIPSIPHPAHDLYNGMLLEPSGVFVRTEDCEECVHLCGDCSKALSLDVPSPPPLSLANNLWIGRIPWELARLTVPEQLLVSLLHPRVFVFKLFPRDKDVRPEDAALQRAMRGNVSTYEQDVAGVAAMVEGRLMLRPASILSSIVTITYIGKDQLQKAWLHRTFRVRREVIRQALLWLKASNPKYYGHIEIDESRLALLPDDDVPNEIMDVARQTTDVGLVDQENSGYVPVLDEDSTTCTMPQESEARLGLHTGESHSADAEPDVIPFQVSGSIDTDLTNLTGNDLMMWGLANLWNKGEEGGYAVRHGSQAVRDLPPLREDAASSLEPGAQRTYFEMAFPCLFPYGTGGVESRRTTGVDFATHIRWLLQYHDRRFRKHETLPFVAFGILQKRAALQHAHVQIRRKDFERDGRVMASLTQQQLETARQQEDKGIPITDPAVQTLRKHVHATAGRVMGTDQSRYNLRSEIRSTGIEHGPPSVWATWNPSDMNCPLAQVLCGAEIDLDHFDATLGPGKHQRAKNIASDPYAAAKFFHFTVKTILQTLAQVRATKFQVESHPGVFGDISAYFGTVEAQGRGTLHLHILIWLKNTPTGDELKDLFKAEAFQTKVKNYIRANIRAYKPGLDSEESIKAILTDPNIGYCRPPDPGSRTYKDDIDQLELRLARSLQVHTCKVRRCLRPNKHGKQECKRKAPWQCSDDNFVNERGEWGPKRKCGYVNGWHPAILVNARCNNDCKLLTNGADTKNITFYVTGHICVP
ncbi:hypothetical protein EW026_g4134 [Hermanssonia centrifuga]|uniref:Uncharacterized protein n=1 Tax=Hermanssonia centrifuga TaxID=98765 RepID=A0A4S4KI44_9APHY|nr:hypothetical protein EW026_g4134 [Hermanssonia centrifuga]